MIRMKPLPVVICWTEVSSHSVVVNVPADFDPAAVELGDALGGLEGDGFLAVAREGSRCGFWMRLIRWLRSCSVVDGWGTGP
ncbi:hypothetical protein [Rhodococcus rhodochrous]|uniref:hypothetical protein n=1 Tax=Rhodococcus rhodochrous TaxID=1829 RepID=UPI0011A5529F|nr:hypothetical protein [Rhodococcus rhodochrous]TWH44431.1 hypothetical protein L612_003200000300 [Rhodococcus rhodochrous J38]